MPLVKSEFSCPTCKKASGKLNQIVANAGELQCTGDGTHRWIDTQSFFNERPTMDFKVAPATFLPQTNHAPITVTVPLGVKTAFEQKYGDKGSATVAALMQVMVEGETMIIPQTDIQRLTERLGKKPSSSGELVGMIFALQSEVSDAKQLAEQATNDVKAYEGMSPGRVVVDLGDQYGEAVGKAKGQEQPLKFWLQEQIKSAIQNNWF